MNSKFVRGWCGWFSVTGTSFDQLGQTAAGILKPGGVPSSFSPMQTAIPHMAQVGLDLAFARECHKRLELCIGGNSALTASPAEPSPREKTHPANSDIPIPDANDIARLQGTVSKVIPGFSTYRATNNDWWRKILSAIWCSEVFDNVSRHRTELSEEQTSQLRNELERYINMFREIASAPALPQIERIESSHVLGILPSTAFMGNHELIDATITSLRYAACDRDIEVRIAGTLSLAKFAKTFCDRPHLVRGTCDAILATMLLVEKNQTVSDNRYLTSMISFAGDFAALSAKLSADDEPTLRHGCDVLGKLSETLRSHAVADESNRTLECLMRSFPFLR